MLASRSVRARTGPAVRDVPTSRLIDTGPSQRTARPITVRGMVNSSRDLINDPAQRQIADYFFQRKLVLEGLTRVRQPVYTLSEEEQEILRRRR